MIHTVRTPEEQILREDFSAQYERLQHPVLQDIERNVCGCDYGGTSWTTQNEADRICDLLGLRPGQRLLEVGAGSGWPGLYLAHETGCDLALVDLPFEGLQIAAQRAADDRLAGCFWIAVSDGVALPFRDQWFDAISHSDVLCCLDAKLEVLQDCRRVIRAGGTMVFSVISIAPGLSSTDRDHAIEFGPPFVESGSDYGTMLGQSDWHIRDRVDLTGKYALTARGYIRELEARQKELEDVLGREEFSTKLTRMRTKSLAIETGLFRRELYVADPAGTD